MLDTESSFLSWIPAFAGMTLARQASGNGPEEIQVRGYAAGIAYGEPLNSALDGNQLRKEGEKWLTRSS